MQKPAEQIRYKTSIVDKIPHEDWSPKGGLVRCPLPLTCEARVLNEILNRVPSCRSQPTEVPMRGLFVMNVNFTFFLWSGLGSIITGKLFIQKPHYYCFRRVQSSSKTFIIMLGIGFVNFLVFGTILLSGNPQRKNILSGKGIFFPLLVLSM